MCASASVVSVIKGASLEGLGPKGTVIYVHEMQEVRWQRQLESNNP